MKVTSREARARPKRNKLFFKNRWLLSQHLVIALRRAGVECDIVVEDRAGNIVTLPTEDPSHPPSLFLGCSDIMLDAALTDVLDSDVTPTDSALKYRH
jgi:hypothetical protein